MSPERYLTMKLDCDRGGTPLEWSYDDIVDAEEAHERYDQDHAFWETARGYRLGQVCEWLWKVHEPPPPYRSFDD